MKQHGLLKGYNRHLFNLARFLHIRSGMEVFLEQFIEKERLPEGFRTLVSKAYLPIAKRLLTWNAEHSGPAPLLVGINGAQGTGKSTLAHFLAEFLKASAGLNVFVLSLDDLYMTRSERRLLAERVHPLLATRGVPGTHDVALAMRLLDAMAAEKAGETGEMEILRSPRFRKELDDRVAEADWHSVNLPVDVVLFEGWCVSARPQPMEALESPVNAFESSADAEGIWRGFVNDALAGAYADLFARIDHTVLLRVPSFDCVLDWRREQEAKLRLSCADSGSFEGQHFMSESELIEFIAHFERLTRWMLVDMPSFAEVLVDFNRDRSFVGLSYGEGAA